MNKKYFALSLGLGLTLAAGVAGLTAATDPRPATALPAADAAPTTVFYGTLEYDDDWFSNGQTRLRSGVYSFTLDPLVSFRPMSSVSDVIFANYGGAYADGYFYYMKGNVTANKIDMSFYKMDVSTWKVVDISGHYAPTKTIAYDMTYDYLTSTMFAVSPSYELEGGSNIFKGYALRTVDLPTGEFTDVAPLKQHYCALACDADGQLWGVATDNAYPHPASLWRIDKTTGAETLVGPLGLNQKSQASTAAFDLRTGRLYWSARTFTYNSAYEETVSGALYVIDTTTGHADVARDYSRQELLSSLFFIDNHPQAPEATTAPQLSLAAGSLTKGAITLTMPTLTFRQNELQAPLSVEIEIDGKVVARAEGLKPGAGYRSPEMEIAEGAHTVKAVCIGASGLRSLPATATIYSGADAPAAVTGITTTLSTTADAVTVSWQAPAKGANGGYIDPATLTYDVVRRPDFKTVARGIKATTLTDEVDRLMGITQYEIIPSAAGIAGKSAVSGLVVAGQPHELPYIETFDNNTAFMSYVTIDAAGDGSSDGNMWLYYANGREAVWWISYSGYPTADDWMVTPALKLSHDRAYLVTFDTHGFSDARDDVTAFDIYSGPQPTVEALKTPAFSFRYKAVSTPTHVEGVFVPAEGDIRIGFRATNNGRDHIALDNIRVADYGPATIPAAPEITSTEVTDDRRVILTVKIPTTAADGSALAGLKTVTVYNPAGRQIATAAAAEPGTTLTLTDTNPTNGVNRYVVKAVNDGGDGVPATVAVDIIPPAPKPVTDVAVGSLGNDAVVTWKYPADMKGADGRKLRDKDLSYNIYRNSALIAKGVTGTSFADADAVQALGGMRQGKVAYRVEAQTDGGKAYAVEGSTIVGASFDLPYTESFANNAAMWTGSNFRASNSGYDPIVREGQDDKWLCWLYSRNAHARSPRINFSSLMEPKLTFWLYRTTDSRYNGATINVYLERVDENGFETGWESLDATFANAGSADGWVECTVDLAKAAGCSRGSLVFAIGGSSGYPHFDNVTVSGVRAANDMRLLSLDGPARCVTGRENRYSVTVSNNGTARAENFEVTVDIDGEVIATRTASLDGGEEMTFDALCTPAADTPERKMSVTATVRSTEPDYSEANNTASLAAEYYHPDVPYITTLRAADLGESVELTWDDADSYPHSISVTDNVESYDNFAISGFGKWTVADRDGAPTLQGISSVLGTYTWANCGAPQAFIVFNPEHLGLTSLCTAYSGVRCFVAFTAASGQNDDWLISPLLLGAKQTLRFHARALHPSYLEEKLEILVSSSGNDPDDFTETVRAITVNSSSWATYEVTLPAGSRYFAMRCVSRDQFGLMIDDIEYVPAQAPVELWGYNVYRDGQRIATEHGENSFTDTTGEQHRLYDYNVTAVYADGESAFSNTASAGRSALTGAEAAEGVTIAPVEGGVRVDGADGRLLTVTTPDGRIVVSYSAKASEFVSLRPGVYIVVAGTTTAKVAVR